MSLYVAAEVIEENIRPVRKFLERTIVGMIIAYLLFWFEGCPIHVVAIGITCHLSFVPLLKSFPYVDITEIKTYIPLVMVLLNHIYFFRWLISIKKDRMAEYHYGDRSDDFPWTNLLGFLFFSVWLVPLTFFVSVMDVQEALPTAEPAKAIPIPTTKSTPVFSNYTTSGSGNMNIHHRGGVNNNNSFYEMNQSNGDGMLDYNDYNDYTSTMQIPSGEDGRRKKKGGLLKKILEPVMKQKENLMRSVVVPLRKEK